MRLKKFLYATNIKNKSNVLITCTTQPFMSKQIDLKNKPTTPPPDLDKKKIKKETELLYKELQDLHYKFFAQEEKALLIVMQGIDASGKWSTVRRVFAWLHPAAVNVSSFRVPTPEEAAHPYLRRAMQKVPALWTIGIFDRSHYEDVLVPKVKKTLSEDDIHKRYKEINQREQMLENNNVKVLKFYFHISKKKQKEKLLRRLVRPERYWKHNISDRETRKYFDDYQKAFETMIEQCNTPSWHIIPTDKGRYKRYLVAKKTVEALQSLKADRPELDTDKRTKVLQDEAQAIKKQLV